MSFEPLIPVGLSLFSGKGEEEHEAIPADETQTSGAFYSLHSLQIDVVMPVCVSIAAQPRMHVRPTVPYSVIMHHKAGERRMAS